MPAFVRWPRHIKAGSVVKGIVTHQDWLATFLAAAGDPDIKEKLLAGHKIGNKTYSVCIDAYNVSQHLRGEVKENPEEHSSISVMTEKFLPFECKNGK